MSTSRFFIQGIAFLFLSAITVCGQTVAKKGMVYDLEEGSATYQAKRTVQIISIDSPGGEYRSELYPKLDYTSNDVERIKTALISGGSLSGYNISTSYLCDTRSTILKIMSIMNGKQPGDLVIIIMSGHGAIVNGDYAFVARDGYVYGKEIWSALSAMESKGLNVIVFLDTCYSGNMKQNMPKSITGKGRIALFCSCKAKEQSFEDSSFTMSRFSYSLFSQFYGMGERYKGEYMSVDFLQSEVYLSTSGQNPSLLLLGDFDSYFPFRKPVTYSELIEKGKTAYKEGRYLESLECYSKAKDIMLMFNKGGTSTLSDEIRQATDAIQKEVDEIYRNSSSETPSVTIQKLLSYEKAYNLRNYNKNRSKYHLYCFKMYDKLKDTEKRDKSLLNGLSYDQNNIEYSKLKKQLDTARKAHESGDFKTAGDIYLELSNASDTFKQTMAKMAYDCYLETDDKHNAFLICKKLWENSHSTWADEMETYYYLPEYKEWKKTQGTGKSVGSGISWDWLLPYYNRKIAASIGNAKGTVPVSLSYYAGEGDLFFTGGMKLSMLRKGHQPSGENDPYIKNSFLLMGGIGYSLMSFSLGVGLADIKNVHKTISSISVGDVLTSDIYLDNAMAFELQPQFTLFTPAMFNDRIQLFGSIGYNFLPKYKSLGGLEFSVGIAYDFY